MSSTTSGTPKTLELTTPAKLNDVHDLSEFGCGTAPIDDYLVKRARKAQDAKHAVVYVSCFSGTNVVAAYYSLSNGAVTRGAVPKRNQRNSPEIHPITILGRMGITSAAQGQGFALDLLQDAIERAIAAAEVVGSSAIIVHPLTPRLVEFYRKAGFTECPPLSPVTMILPLV